MQGGDTPDFLVRLNPASLLARGVSAQDVETALAKNNEINAVGFYDQSFLRYQVLVSGLLRDTQDIGNVTVAVKNRVPVTLGEVGTVTRGTEPHTVETSGDGHPAVLLSVIKQPAGNTVQVADGIKAALAEAKPLLPADVTVTNYYDQSEIVRESQNSVVEALIIGGILALIVLMLFLGNLRTAAIVLIILPLTIIISFALMKLLGQTLNIMTLGALAVALGLVIDDGIVVVENMFTELESGKERPDAVAAGLQAITPAMVGSSLTTMAAFLPLTFLNDLDRPVLRAAGAGDDRDSDCLAGFGPALDAHSRRLAAARQSRRAWRQKAQACSPASSAFSPGSSTGSCGFMPAFCASACAAGPLFSCCFFPLPSAHSFCTGASRRASSRSSTKAGLFWIISSPPGHR